MVTIRKGQISITVRMYYATLQKLKKRFPATRNESVADYFERLAREIKEIQQ